jgi:hypothetical protein
MMAVFALAWNTEARAPAAGVRLNATAANTSPALLAQNRPDGRWVRALPFRSEPTDPGFGRWARATHYENHGGYLGHLPDPMGAGREAGPPTLLSPVNLRSGYLYELGKEARECLSTSESMCTASGLSWRWSIRTGRCWPTGT